jgi:hypothetical protein
MNSDLNRDSITVAFSVSSERICCLCIHIACKNSFHNTTYVRGFDAFWLIMGRLVSLRPHISSVKALNRRRCNLATFQSHAAFLVGPVLDCSEDGNGKFLWSVPISSLPVVINQKTCIVNTTVRTSNLAGLYSLNVVMVTLLMLLIPVDFPLPDARSRLCCCQFERVFVSSGECRG